VGRSIDVDCSECGYATRVLVGQGRHSPATYELVICKACAEVDGADITQERLACSRCGGEGIVHIALGHGLRGRGAAVTGPDPRNAVYECPKCGKQALRFRDDRLPTFWD